jgi:stage IV sporulation protein A
MEKFDIFRDMAERTGGDVYIGVVGPVRTGKSTLIRRFMDLVVLPNIADENDRERARDAMPQGGAGRTVMTTEPKFVPDEGVAVRIRDQITLRMRLVDCVGYAVPGALGYEEEDGPRMVRTPWFDEAVPFEQAAEVGTRKVIAEHSTVGLVVTTDGSVTDLPREAYAGAEERVVAELRELGKPFLVVLNSTHPYADETRALAEALSERYDVTVQPLDVSAVGPDDIDALLERLLYEFPVQEVGVELPDWVATLPTSHWLRQRFDQAVLAAKEGVVRLRDIDRVVDRLAAEDVIDGVVLRTMDLGSGTATIETGVRPALMYEVMSELAGEPVDGQGPLMRLFQVLVNAKREYDRVEDALRDVRTAGYGLVAPTLGDIDFAQPELIRQGNRFGVRLRAQAPSIHMIRADVQTEVVPIIGTEKQGEDLMQYLLDRFESDPSKLWESDIFGKSLSELMREELQGKLVRMPDNAQEKLRETLERIVNEGSGGLICILI